MLNAILPSCKSDQAFKKWLNVCDTYGVEGFENATRANITTMLNYPDLLFDQKMVILELIHQSTFDWFSDIKKEKLKTKTEQNEYLTWLNAILPSCKSDQAFKEWLNICNTYEVEGFENATRANIATILSYPGLPFDQKLEIINLIQTSTIDWSFEIEKDSKLKNKEECYLSWLNIILQFCQTFQDKERFCAQVFEIDNENSLYLEKYKLLITEGKRSTINHFFQALLTRPNAHTKMSLSSKMWALALRYYEYLSEVELKKNNLPDKKQLIINSKEKIFLHIFSHGSSFCKVHGLSIVTTALAIKYHFNILSAYRVRNHKILFDIGFGIHSIDGPILKGFIIEYLVKHYGIEQDSIEVEGPWLSVFGYSVSRNRVCGKLQQAHNSP